MTFPATTLNSGGDSRCTISDVESPKARPFVIPVFIPHAGCSHQCAFCNQSVITGKLRHMPNPKEVHHQINRFLTYRKDPSRPTQIAFYGGNFLGLSEAYMMSLLSEAEHFIFEGKVDSLRFSTRPDTVTEHRLDLIEAFSVSTIELGVQSMNDHVLTAVNRGHTAADTRVAIGRLKIRNYQVGAQMMIGLPEDDDMRALETGRRLANLEPDFVRIYPTVVLAGSPLSAWYDRGFYRPLSLEAAVALTKTLYILFHAHHIPVIRMGLQASQDLDEGSAVRDGPYHPSFGHLVLSKLFLDMTVSALGCKNFRRDRLALRVNSRNISRIRGLKNKNMDILKKRFHLKAVTVIPDDTLPLDALEIDS